MHVGKTFKDAFLVYAPLRNRWVLVDTASYGHLTQIGDQIDVLFQPLGISDEVEDQIDYSLSRAFFRSKQLQRVSKSRRNYATRA